MRRTAAAPRSPLAAILLSLLGLASLQLAAGDYKLSSLSATPVGWTGALSLTSPGPYSSSSPDLQALTLNVVFQTASRLHVSITAANRWQIPKEVLVLGDDPSTPPPSRLYDISFTSNPFGFAVTRLSDNSVLFNTTSPSAARPSLVFEDQYLEISSQLPPNHFTYGFAERNNDPVRLDDGTYTFWNSDCYVCATNKNTYGSHPYYLRMEKASQAHGVMLFNLNDMDIVLGNDYVTYKSTGGVFDFYFILGPLPSDVVQQYTDITGKPYMPPYWSLGFHQSHWGYATVMDTKQVVVSYEKFQIPLDTIWNDIDYMQNYYMFTVDPKRYPADQMQAFHSWLSDRGQHHVMILDPGVPADWNQSAYANGVSQDIFVKFGDNATNLHSRVWPHINVTFPDFSHPRVQAFWTAELQKFMTEIGGVSGLWIDMNEPSSFCDGGSAPFACRQIQGPWFSDPPHDSYVDNPFTGPYINRIQEPPYLPGGVPVQNGTIDISAYHIWGQHYNVHNLYGFLEARTTHRALEQITNKRPFILTRSNTFGSQRYAAHWTGDNEASFTMLRGSVAQIQTLGLSGLSFVGSDICGFAGADTTEELCLRWMQTGALYPFSRNHYGVGKFAQEPYALGLNVIGASQSALSLRYSLLPYLYNLFIVAHRTGLPVWRTLFLEFPDDTAAFALSDQLMIGDSLLFMPVLQQGQTSVSGYFPAGRWYNYTTGDLVSSAAQTLTVQAPPCAPYTIPLFARGGKAILRQQPALTTNKTRQNPLSLLFALDEQGSAQGQVSWDDGEDLNIIGSHNFSFSASFPSSGSQAGHLTLTPSLSAYPDVSYLTYSTITIYGAPSSFDFTSVAMSVGPSPAISQPRPGVVVLDFTAAPLSASVSAQLTFKNTSPSDGDSGGIKGWEIGAIVAGVLVAVSVFFYCYVRYQRKQRDQENYSRMRDPLSPNAETVPVF